jgi:(p)ppGpp synthase/HD superfamily hydrolase
MLAEHCTPVLPLLPLVCVHDLLEDTDVDRELIKAQFGEGCLQHC